MILLFCISPTSLESDVFLGDWTGVDFADLELCSAEVTDELRKHVSGHVHRSATLTAVGGCVVPQVLASAPHTPASEVPCRLIVGIVHLPKPCQFALISDVLVAHYCLLSKGMVFKPIVRLTPNH